MSTLRREPYIWPTWITGLLSGESHCEWSAWFKAHYRDYEKAPRSINLTQWTAEHNQMVNTRAEKLRASGYKVFIEDQNGFVLKGKAATLGGKADIVAICVNEDQPGPGPHPPYDALVIDCKSGKPRDKDIWQVLIYMMVLPLSVPHCKGITLRGEVQYRDSTVDIGPERLTDHTRQMIRSTIERVAREDSLPVVPSEFECRFCDITGADCKNRVEPADKAATECELW